VKKHCATGELLCLKSSGQFVTASQ
jgi:hypothetical protein